MKKQKKPNKSRSLFLILFLFSTSLLSIKTFNNVSLGDIKISGSDLISREDIVTNSSLNLPSRLIFIKTKFIEKELKRNLSLENISINRQILPFGLSIRIKTKEPFAYGERLLDGKKILGFIDKNGFFLNNKYVDYENMDELTITIYGWEENFRKTLSKILNSQTIDEIELIAIHFSQNGFLSLEEKYLKTILLGFNTNLIESQLQIISNLKDQLKENNISEKIDNIDLTDPDNPKIKVFKP